MKKIIKLVIRYFKNIKVYFVLKMSRIEYENFPEINGKLFLKNYGVVKFGKNVVLNSAYKFNPIGGQTFTSIFVEKNACLEIGEKSGISNTAIYCAEKIVIGKKVYIGGNCKIYDTDFHSLKLEDRMKRPEINQKEKSVYIKDGAFIGGSTIILKGVTIGKESVIGAGSVVSKNIPDYEVWAGNPVKFIRKMK